MPNHGKCPDGCVSVRCGWCWTIGASIGSQWEVISVAERLGHQADSVRKWVRRAEGDEGRRAGAISEELAELKRLQRENAELKRANDILGPRRPSSG